MNCDSQKNEEDRFSEMIGTADKGVSQPDRAFLAGLKTESTRRFLETASPARMKIRNSIMAKVRKFAPSALAASLIGAIGVAIVLLSSGEDSTLWANAQKHIEQAKCMKMKTAVTLHDGTKVHGRQTLAIGGFVRQDLSVVKTGEKTVEMVMIMNHDKGILLTLMKDQKTAKQTRFTDMPKAVRDKMLKERDQLAEIKRMIRNAEKELGDKTIDGVKTKGFRVNNKRTVMDIWVDAKTALPIRMEGEITNAKTKFVLSDIEFVDEINPALFSVKPPKGYKIQPQQTISMTPAGIEDLTGLFKTWVALRDGVFPDAIEDGLLADTNAYIRKRKNTGGLSKEDLAILAKIDETLTNQGVGARVLMHTNKTFHYQGKGVKLGDKDTAVLWYKSEGKDKYTVMFGDLSFKRMLEKDLPQSSTKRTN
jgi:outer membrane lipoprotein-sorting protein